MMKNYIAIGLAVFLACSSVLSSHFHTIDEGSMFVTAANIVNRRELHTNQLGWAQWANRPGEEQGLVSEAGDVYSKKSPIVIALLVPLVALGRWFGMIRMALLFGPICTTLTALLLHHTAQTLGYSLRASTLAVLVFALSTMALPYSRLAMGEQVAAFGILLSLFASLSNRSPKHFLCGVGLALAVGANAVYALFIPILALFIIVQHRRLTALISFGLPIAILGLALAGYNYIRFGDIWQTGYHFAPGQEGFSTPLWWGVLGLTISPARGFVWYNPPALLALFGWLRFYRTHRPLSWLIVVVIATHLLAFGMWWEWWGGYGWGPRFLLPIVPGIILVCLPFIESRDSIKRLIVGLTLAAGLVVQIAGIAIDFNIYESELEAQFPVSKDQPLYYHHDPALVYDIARSPLVVHFQRLPTATLDFAWWPGAWAPASIPNIIGAIQSSPTDEVAILYLVPELIDPLVVTQGLPPTYGLPVNVSPADPLAQRLFARARRDPNRLWMITWYGSGDPGNWYELQLREQWASLSEETLDGYRVIQFVRPPTAIKRHSANDSFGPIRLTQYGVQTDGDMLFVELKWRLVETANDDDYVMFVHVLAPDGSLIAGQDRQPLGGYRPTRAWQPSEVIVDRFAFSLDQLDGLTVEVGWYSWPSLERLPLTNATGQHLERDSLALNIDR